MNPEEYFSAHGSSWGQLQEFCSKFGTMREAWDSSGMSAEWMLWILSRDGANKPRLDSFCIQCIKVHAREIPDPAGNLGDLSLVQHTVEFALRAMHAPVPFGGYLAEAARYSNAHDWQKPYLRGVFHHQFREPA